MAVFTSGIVWCFVLQCTILSCSATVTEVPTPPTNEMDGIILDIEGNPAMKSDILVTVTEVPSPPTNEIDEILLDMEGNPAAESDILATVTEVPTPPTNVMDEIILDMGGTPAAETDILEEPKKTQRLRTDPCHFGARKLIEEAIDYVMNKTNDEIDNRLIAVIDYLDNELKTMKTSIENLQNQLISQAEDGTKRNQVSFRVIAVRNRKPGAQQQPILFKTILENQGEGYDNGTGVFTAPVGGQYVFWTHLCAITSVPFTFSFVRDHEQIQSFEISRQNSAATGRLCAASTLMTTLKPGSKVWVVSKKTRKSNCILADTKNTWNIFSGVLVNYFT